MFTQKEMDLLKDLRDEEELCIQKYAKYETEAKNCQLKQLFAQLGQKEQSHRDTINQIMAGNIPPLPAGGGQQGEEMPAPAAYGSDQEHNADKFLCSDALATEKHVSSLYDTCIFEFKDKAVRDILNHIQ